ncbi:MAG: SDR family NAD(P)-dependent oxidoreductase, partial [Herbaspirillum sp.]
MRDQCVVITGGNGTLGQAAAKLTKERGGRVVLLDLGFSETVLANFECHVVDLTDAQAVSRTMQSIGPVQVLFNVAGGFSMGAPVHDPDDISWEIMFARNVSTLRAMLKAVVPGMRERN